MGVGIGVGPGIAMTCTGLLIASYLPRTAGIVTVEWSRAKTKQGPETKQEELSHLSNGLVEPLGKSF